VGGKGEGGVSEGREGKGREGNEGEEGTKRVVRFKGGFAPLPHGGGGDRRPCEKLRESAMIRDRHAPLASGYGPCLWLRLWPMC
jgi:hypothetical protein